MPDPGARGAGAEDRGTPRAENRGTPETGAKDRVMAIVPTFNLRAKLANTLEALAAQTRPVNAVLVIANGSPEDVAGRVASLELDLPVGVVRVPRNTGIAGGYGVGIASALDTGADWVWLMDDDMLPVPDCLEHLLLWAERHPEASALAPRVDDVLGIIQGHHRGWYRYRHTYPVPEKRYQEGLVKVDYLSYSATLVRRSAALATGGPDQRWFLWADDLEWSLRLGELGPLYLCPGTRLIHDDDHVRRPPGLVEAIRNHFAVAPNAVREGWRYLLTFRNVSWMRRHRDGEGPLGWLINYAMQALRVLVIGQNRRQSLKLFWWYGLAGRRGNFNHIDPAVWREALGDRSQTARLHPDGPEAQPWEPQPQLPVQWVRAPSGARRALVN